MARFLINFKDWIEIWHRNRFVFIVRALRYNYFEGGIGGSVCGRIAVWEWQIPIKEIVRSCITTQPWPYQGHITFLRAIIFIWIWFQVIELVNTFRMIPNLRDFVQYTNCRKSVAIFPGWPGSGSGAVRDTVSLEPIDELLTAPNPLAYRRWIDDKQEPILWQVNTAV